MSKASQPKADAQLDVFYASLEKLKKINKNREQSAKYYNLSLSMSSNKDEIRLGHPTSGKLVNKKELLILAVELNPDNAYALNNLSSLLAVDEQVKLLINGTEQTRSKLDLLTLAIKICPSYANALCNLGVAMEGASLSELEVEIDGESIRFTPTLAYQKALQADPQHSLAYNNLGLCLTECEQRVSIHPEVHSKGLSDQELFVKAIQCDPQNAEAFYNLSTTLKDQNEVVSLEVAGERLEFNKQGLLISTISLNPCHSNAYFNLACALYQTQQSNVWLDINGKRILLDEKSLYQMSLACDPSNAKAYYNLGLLLDDSAQVIVRLEGKSQLFSKIDLFRKAIEHQPDFVEVYFALASCLQTLNSTVELVVGKQRLTLSKFELLEFVLKQDPHQLQAEQEIEGICSKNK